MFDDIATLFREQVCEAYLDYRTIRESPESGISADLRAATQLCVALYHFREHFEPVHPYSRCDVENLCPDYRLVGDVTNATKHRQLDRGKPLLRDASSIREVIVITVFEDDEGDYMDFRKVVFVDQIDGSVRDVFEAGTNVMNFWGRELVRYSIRKSFTEFPLPDRPGSKFLARSEVKGFALKAIQGVGLTKLFETQRFNPNAEKSEPLEVRSLKLSVLRPMVEVEVCIDLADGRRGGISAKVTRKQAEVITGIGTELEQLNYLVGLIAQDPSIRIPRTGEDGYKDVTINVIGGQS